LRRVCPGVSPWTGFSNLAFEQQPTLPIPRQELCATVLWRLHDNRGLLVGLADSNGDPSNPSDSVTNLFDEGELFKHIAIDCAIVKCWRAHTNWMTSPLWSPTVYFGFGT